MKRYFLVPPGYLPHELEDGPYYGEYHYIDLDSHGPNGAGWRALVMFDQSKASHPEWVPLMHLLDSQTTAAALPAVVAPALPVSPIQEGGAPVPVPMPIDAVPVAPATLLADTGVDSAQTGYVLAKTLTAIHPAFEP